jgi:hypothetical protein
MIMVKNSKRIFSVLLFTGILAASLAGCGGGGGSTPPPAYNVQGVGVIMQNRITAQSLGGSINPAWKTIDLSGTFQPLAAVKNVHALSVSDDFLQNNPAYIYLKWDPVNGASHYQISYQGAVVWDSDDSHTDDPTFIDASPQAYLDLDKELDRKISSAGQYPFQVTAFNEATELAQLPAVTVSLGMILERYPANISYTSSDFSLAWEAVQNASGYRVRVYDGLWAELAAAGSGTTLLTGTNYSISGSGKGLTAGTHYNLTVDAISVDGSGKPVEIARGISGFTY